MSRTSAPLALWLALSSAACGALLNPKVAVDPGATFAAHVEHGRIAIDRLEGGRTGALVPPGIVRFPGTPTYRLESDGQSLASLWLEGSTVTARETASADGPVVARVDPSWDDGSVRLTLGPVAEGPLRSDAFARRQGGGPTTLTRAAQTVLDVRGVYEAPVRDPHGKQVGWLRIRVSPYLAAPRIYEATLPSTVSPVLAAGAVAALDAEIDWIEAHTVNVYRGNGSGPLERSVPVGR